MANRRESANDVRAQDDTQYLSPHECAVVLEHRHADALLALLEGAINAGMDPGPGLRVDAAEEAGFRIVTQRNIESDPYNRGPRIVAVTFRPSTVSPVVTEDRPQYVAPSKHAPTIAAFIYRGVLVCRSCVLPEESDMAGQFFDHHGVRGSGWKCDRCGVEIEHQPHPPPEEL